MKIIMSFILCIMGQSVWAKTCDEQGISLYGDVVFFNKTKGEVKQSIEYAKFPKRWNVNSNPFQSLYLKMDKVKSEKVQFILKSKKVEEFSSKRKYKVSSQKVNKDLYKIENINLKKDILPSFILLPVSMQMIVFNKDKEICRQKFYFEVIK